MSRVWWYDARDHATRPELVAVFDDGSGRRGPDPDEQDRDERDEET